MKKLGLGAIGAAAAFVLVLGTAPVQAAASNTAGQKMSNTAEQKMMNRCDARATQRNLKDEARQTYIDKCMKTASTRKAKSTTAKVKTAPTTQPQG